VGENLPSKCEALSSNLCTTKKNSMANLICHSSEVGWAGRGAVTRHLVAEPWTRTQASSKHFPPREKGKARPLGEVAKRMVVSSIPRSLSPSHSLL
jgi:hypothetical protein